jgi:hypothetical protein
MFFIFRILFQLFVAWNNLQTNLSWWTPAKFLHTEAEKKEEPKVGEKRKARGFQRLVSTSTFSPEVSRKTSVELRQIQLLKDESLEE